MRPIYLLTIFLVVSVTSQGPGRKGGNGPTTVEPTDTDDDTDDDSSEDSSVGISYWVNYSKVFI